jgi:threonine synthase
LTIADAGRFLRENAPQGAFDVSTLREPYRIEGKKTMAYELVEQLDGGVPDVVLYPTGGGTGLIFVSVQAAGCEPVVKGFVAGRRKAGRYALLS